MTYNEWRDELKSNLLCVSESERRRVLDYYAEAYADRRDAGFTEREIIEDFGAPYDAAQRILSENNDYYSEPPQYYEQPKEERRREREREKNSRKEEERQYRNPPPAAPAECRGDYTWIFVLLCVIFAVPIFIVVMCMIGFTVTVCCAPIIALISGVASVGAGIGGLFVSATNGAMTIGVGLIVFGVGLILMPVCFGIVKWMWKLFRMFFVWLRKLFGGKKVA